MCRAVLSVLLTVAVAGCTTDPVPERYRAAEPIITIDIRSIPPGAIIYANAEYVGTTPLELKVVADKYGNWKQGMRIQAYVPHDSGNFEEAVYPEGFRVPSKLLLRVPGYTRWYSATQQHPPTGLTVQ
jgi:type IV pilus biogenesis protein CpaD/CtpE